MPDNTPQQLINKLDDILDAERQALLDGDLDQLVHHLSNKEALLDEISTIEVHDAEPMSSVQEKLRRNQVLLDGALQGIRRAAARMSAMRRVRKSLETYDEDGRKKIIEGQVTRKVERRA